MTASEWATIIAAIAAPIGAIVALLKWWITRLDTTTSAERKRLDEQREKEIERQDELREELRHDMQKRIDEMMKTIKLQGSVVNGLMTHIRLLEQNMAKAGLDIPVLNIEDLVGRLQ